MIQYRRFLNNELNPVTKANWTSEFDRFYKWFLKNILTGEESLKFKLKLFG